MSQQQNKLQKDRNQKILLELASLPGNNICADCKTRMPRWASHNLGIFICTNCARIHRGIGTHVTKVKSLTMDDWTKEQIEHMKSMGNVKSNAIYNPNELRNPPPPNLDDTDRDSEIEHHIRAKYEYMKFFDKSALVASKLGPSQSAATIALRSSTLPTSNSSQVAASSKAPVNIAPATAPASIRPTQPSQVAQPNQIRSASQPVPQTFAPQAPPQKPTGPSGGVWDDISSLSNSSQNSTLPLQYQSGLSNQPRSTGFASLGINPYQLQQVGINPYAQQQSQSSYVSVQQPQMVTSQSMGYYPTTPHTSQSASAPFFQPQPQGSLQAQMSTSNSGYLSPSPNIMSSSQTYLSSHNPAQQFLSHSPQPQMQMHSPSTTPQGQLMYQSPASAQQASFDMGSGIPSGHGFLGMTTMQMQQQAMLQQQQQQQMQQQQMQHHQMQQQQMQQQLMQQQLQQQQQQLTQAMHAPTQPQMAYGQLYPQGGFSGQGGGQQWGAM